MGERSGEGDDDGAGVPWLRGGGRRQAESREGERLGHGNPGSLREAGNNICFCLIPSQVMITIYII